MLIFDKISGLFTNRASTHSSDPAPSSPPSDATSDQIRRAQTAGGRNTAYSSVNSGATLVQLDGASSSGRDVSSSDEFTLFSLLLNSWEYEHVLGIHLPRSLDTILAF